MKKATVPDALAVRRRFGSLLSGAGVEIGPGHVPFPVPSSVTVRYVDRWEPGVNRSLFPELGDSPGFPQPDIVADLDVDRLGALADGSQDFVIASHVLEHLANPLAMLVDCYRVLRPGGLLVVLVPDRHQTFDRLRSPTPLAHLIEEHEDDVRVVDDRHILDFLQGTSEVRGDRRDSSEFTAQRMAAEIALHRRRSVHVNVWNFEEFTEVLRHSIGALGLRFEVVDAMAPGAEGTHGDEFGWVLARADGATVRRRRRRRLPFRPSSGVQAGIV